MKERTILESWKEIAVYLKRSVRTCRRWEQEFGLPVHRLGDTVQGHVFAETNELDAWLKEKLSLAAPAPRTPPLLRSIAVLPIENLTGEADNDYFADGLTEVLITEMGQFGAIRVISHQSVRQFRDSNKSVREIAKLLNVEALVEGALLQTKGRIRLSMNLIGVHPERHIWAQLYECEPSESAELPRRISRTVMYQSGVMFSQRIEDRFSNRPSPRVEAYEHYLQGRASVRKSFLKADIERALSYFDRAISLDPGYSLAYAEKAWAYSQLGTYSHLAPTDAFPRQKEAARRAIEIDPALAEGHAALGHASAFYDWDWPQADEYFRQALELNPNSQRTLFFYTQYLILMGRDEDSIRTHRRLIELDPLNPENHWNWGWANFWARRYDEAVNVFKNLLERAPDDHWLEMALGLTYLHLGLPDRALEMSERARTGVPLGVDMQFECFTAYVFGTAGKQDKAREILCHMTELAKVRTVDHTQIALVHLSLGENEDALKEFERAYQEKSPMMVYLKVAPFWKPLGRDPRFRDLFRRMGFSNPQLT